jgi:hypothetical protein
MHCMVRNIYLTSIDRCLQEGRLTRGVSLQQPKLFLVAPVTLEFVGKWLC